MSGDIAIIGGGIGGLTLALALEKQGINFQLYEKAPCFEALGYGIQISPNVVTILQDLGLGESLHKIAHQCYGFELRSFDEDSILARWKLNHSIPYYQCRRADFHELLFNALKDKNKVNFSHYLNAITTEKEEIILQFSNGKNLKFKGLIGADGVHSLVRKLCFPEENPAKYAGYVAYRVILPFKEKYQSFWGKATVWMGENHHVVAYPNHNQNKEEKWLNLVLVKKEKNWTNEGWTIPAAKKEISKNFESNSPTLNQIVEDIVTDEKPCYKWGLFTHKPLPYWAKNNLTLLGDSAHPMLPFQAQGAAMAIEDAYALAYYLNKEKNRENAFKKYEQIRLKRTIKVQETSRNNADIFHATGIKAMVRNLFFQSVNFINGDLLNGKTAWIYNYDLTTLLK